MGFSREHTKTSLIKWENRHFECDRARQKNALGRLLYCITLRQWSFLFTILTFIMTSLFLLCSVLGLVHLLQLITMLQNDKNEQKDKILLSDFDIASNESKLQTSFVEVEMLVEYVAIFITLTAINLITNFFAIYGLVTRKVGCIKPWINVGSVTSIITTFFSYLALGGYLKYFQINTYEFVMVVCLNLIFIYMRCEVNNYCMMLKGIKTEEKKIRSYGAYTHTVQGIDVKKAPVV